MLFALIPENNSLSHVLKYVAVQKTLLNVDLMFRAIFQDSKKEQVRGYSRLSAQTGAESNYIEVMQNGIENFIDNLTNKLWNSSTGNLL